MKKKFTSILALCMALTMCCMITVPAFATENTAQETTPAGIDEAVLEQFYEDVGDQDVRIVAVGSSDGGIMPIYEQEGLLYVENAQIDNILTNKNYTVNPTKNSTLRIWLMSTGPVTLQVRHAGLFDYTLDYRESFDAGERDVQVVQKCTKDQYLIQVSSPEYITFSFLVYEQRW